jgi:hypothetical protein
MASETASHDESVDKDFAFQGHSVDSDCRNETFAFFTETNGRTKKMFRHIFFHPKSALRILF